MLYKLRATESPVENESGVIITPLISAGPLNLTAEQIGETLKYFCK